MSKNIVVFSDGTGQEGGKGSNTNVYKLFNMIMDRTPDQVGFYDRGLGTGWRKFTGSVAGAGMSENIQECYRFIFENFNAGDQIFLFGFSRGAATVRSLSSFIHMFGILPKSRPELIKRAYKIYKSAKGGNDDQLDKRERRAAEFVARNHTMWTKIRFLAVWDTVAALGVPSRSVDVFLDRLPFWRHNFHNFELSKSVEHARHALAIDDERLTFHPLVWEPEIRDYQTMKQVWFCGMHTDVGGGYAEHGLSDIALGWMAREAVAQGLAIFPGNKVEANPDPDGFMHDSRSGFPGRIFRRKERSWPSGRPDMPVVHASVIERTQNQQNDAAQPYGPWILKGQHETDLDTAVRKPQSEGTA